MASRRGGVGRPWELRIASHVRPCVSGSRGPAGAFLVRSRGEAVMRSLCASKSRRAGQGCPFRGSFPAPSSTPGWSPGRAESLSPRGAAAPKPRPRRPGLGPGVPAGRCSFLPLETRSKMLGKWEGEGEEEAGARPAPQGSAESIASQCQDSITY